MRRANRMLTAVMVFVLCFGCVLIVGAKAYNDGSAAGYQKGFREAEQMMTAYYNHAFQMQETELGAMVEAANKRADTAETELAAMRADKSVENLRAVENDDGEKKHSMSEWWSEDDVFCLAAVIYQEAGGDACTDETRRMVADVVLNRVFDERWPNTIREVLEDAPGGALQYGRFAITGVQFPESAENECEKDAVLRAWRIAESVLEGEHSELYGEGYIWQSEYQQSEDSFYREGIWFGR